MGISGIFKQIGPGTRISLAKLSAEHFAAHGRPLRIAIDISIWLFQIQAGKGGSNPALRTFYYRLLRLLTLNIHPLFVFDGPNKPLFKRNKKVGGPGVKVTSVPEFLAKQLLKQFGFPWHVAPGEAEAECALIQTQGVVDAVLSEDVDTLMFGSGITLRNWTPESKGTTPTHVNVYRAEETKSGSGLDREGMILVALMSGGDYLPDGIPGCGPKVACDAARAGFGKSLCALNRRDPSAIQAWKDKLEQEIKTNESKYFSQKKPSFNMPEDFPNVEVLGYYTHPCVSTDDKLSRLRDGLKFDQDIDFPALRSFASDAFDWRCLGGAKKFIRNLAPAMLVRELRMRGKDVTDESQEAQQAREQSLVSAIHGKRNHKSTDGILEYRVSFIPADFVHIDLSLEDEDDEYRPAGGEQESDAETEILAVVGSDNEEAASPTKRTRTTRPYNPSEPEKLWIPRDFVQIGCPLTVELYEASFKDPKAFLAARGKAKKATAAKTKSGKKTANEQSNSMMSYAIVSKPQADREALKELNPRVNSRPAADVPKAFRVLSTHRDQQVLPDQPVPESEEERILHERREHHSKFISQARPFAAFGRNRNGPCAAVADTQKTPRKKRRSSEMASTPATQRTLDSYFSGTPPNRSKSKISGIVDLTDDSPLPRPSTPSPASPRIRRFDAGFQLVEADLGATPIAMELEVRALPSSVTKRKKRAPLKRHQTAPTRGHDDLSDLVDMQAKVGRQKTAGNGVGQSQLPVVDLISSSPQGPPAPPDFIRSHSNPSRLTAVFSADEDQDAEVSILEEPPTTFPRRSPRVSTVARKKTLMQARVSLAGAWKEVDADTEQLDLTGLGGSGGRGHRASAVEVLRLDD